MLGLLAKCSAQPLVVRGVSGVERNGFFRAGDRGVGLLRFVVGLCQQQVNLGVAGIVGRRAKERLDCPGVIARFVGAASCVNRRRAVLALLFGGRSRRR